MIQPLANQGSISSEATGLYSTDIILVTVSLLILCCDMQQADDVAMP